MPCSRTWITLLTLALATNFVVGAPVPAQEPANHEIAALQRTIDEARVQLSYRDRPLGEVLDALRKEAGVSILMDPQVLHAEGVDDSYPTTIEHAERVSLATALETILTPLSLSYQVTKHGHIRLVALDKSGSELHERVYNLSWLLSPRLTELLAQGRYDSGRDLRPEPKSTAVRAIICAIVEGIEPESWQLYGSGDGQATIEPVTNTDEVVIIRQTAAAHRQIADLLEQLQQLTELQVLVTAQEFALAAASWDAFAKQHVYRSDSPVLDEKTVKEFQEIAKSCHAPQRSMAFDGEVLHVAIRPPNKETGNQDLALRPVVTTYRDAVRLDWEFGKTKEQPANRCRVPVGSSVLIEIAQSKQDPEQPGLRYLVLLTPTILIQPERRGEAMEAMTKADVDGGVLTKHREGP